MCVYEYVCECACVIIYDCTVTMSMILICCESLTALPNTPLSLSPRHLHPRTGDDCDL